MPKGSRNRGNEGNEIDMGDAVSIANRLRRPATALESFDMGTSDVNNYDGEDGDAVDADLEAGASHAEDGSTQNMYD
jgi:hypothetical protein